jgi:hypothetical protein
MSDSDKRRARAARPHRDLGNAGVNPPRGDVDGLAGPGEGGGPAGVQRSGGREANRERSGSGVAPGMTPGDLQKSPEELVDEWTEK